MIFRLEYKNKALKTARVDIITPTGTGVETVEGTGYPFMLKYEGDKKNKGLMFLSSSAEINIYETPLFNIDTLKTSGEKDIRVNYYIDSVLEWTGFVIPDFFSREIGGDGVVSMVASDRLAVLDSEVLEGLPVTVTLRALLSLSLAKTGLALPLKTVVDFATVSGNTDHVLNHSIRSQRLTDTKGRSVNCKDIIKSILVATNSKIMQRKGEWWVVNKMQHELGAGRVYTSPTAFTNYVEDLISFTDVTRGAMRTIAPVAGGVGVFQEYGGGKLIPDNYNFKNGLTGWTNYNGFVSSTNNRRVLGYTQSGDVYTPIYDDAGTSEPYLVNRNISPFWVLIQPSRLGSIPDLWNPYAIKSTRIISPVVSGDSTSAKVAVEINAVGLNGTYLPFSVVLKRPGRETLLLNRNNEWQTRAIAHLLSFKNDNGNNLTAVSAGMSVSATITAESSGEVLDDVGTYTIEVLIFGSGLQGDNSALDTTTLINSASVQFSAASNDTPKGTLYKADQGGESYTKIHDTETTVFGDYLTGGLNGYFYNYAPDDTSSLLAPSGSRSQPAWVNTYTQNTEPLPLLQQTIRQMRRMFSVAHDFIKGEIDVADFDPLSIFEDCERRFVIVEAEFDFLRGSLQVVLEEVAYQNLTVREYIYSYFGEGDEGIRGISGISAGSSGGGGGGGGMAPEPSWLENEITIDPDSGLLSVDGWHVKGSLIIEGQVNQWLAQQLVVDDARIQVNRRQGGATVDSGLVIYNKDTTSEVSSLVYDVNGIWRAGGQRIYTDAYKPLADNATNLGGFSAASYPRKAEAAVIRGEWTFRAGEKHLVNIVSDIAATSVERISGIQLGRVSTQNSNHWELYARSNSAWGILPDFHIEMNGGTDTARYRAVKISGQDGLQGFVGLGLGEGVNPSERLHVADNGLFEGNLTTQGNLSAVNAALSGTLDVTGAGTFGGNLSAVNAALSGTLDVTAASTFGGNVGTSNFASQSQGWRVTPAGIADFRHIYTDELQAKAFTADISQALVGSDVLTKSVAKLAQDWTSTANGATSNLYVEELEGFAGYQVFAVGDRLLLRVFDRSGGGLLIKNIWATVASYVSTTDNVQRYTITVNSGGMTGQTVYRGSMILDYGTSGSGVIERTVLDAMGSPYSQVKTWVNDPSNPANYTIHNRTGNLDGIANASGFGFYGENTFLTGKLLVGDLTKAGQYMEYENGQLTLKGSVTVTGGNAATKADVDAVQVGGRNLVLNSDQEINVAVGDFSVSSNLIEVDKGQQVAISFDVKTTAAYDGNIVLVEYFDDSGVRQGFEWISGEVTTNWTRIKRVLTMPTSSWFAKVSLGYRSTTPASQVNTFRRAKLETGNRATDWTPAPEDVDAGIAAAESNAKDYTDALGNSLGDAAFVDKVEAAMLGTTVIDGGYIKTSLLNVEQIVAQGITTDTIEGLTLNFDKGTIGAWTIDNNVLLSASNLVELNAVENKIAVRHAEGSGYGVELGDFGLTDTGALGNKIKGIIDGQGTLVGADWEYFRLGYGGVSGYNPWQSNPVSQELYLSSTGEFSPLVQFIGGLKAGASYSLNVNFYLYLPSQGWDGINQLTSNITTVQNGLSNIPSPFSGTSVSATNVTVKVEIIGAEGTPMQEFGPYDLNYGTLPPVNWGNQFFRLLEVNDLSFVPTSSSVRVKVTLSSTNIKYFCVYMDGTQYRVQEGRGRVAIGRRLGSGGDLNGDTGLMEIIRPNLAEISSKGLQVLCSSQEYLRVRPAFNSNYIEARGDQEFISPNGTYRLRVTNTGIQKSTDGGIYWTNV